MNWFRNLNAAPRLMTSFGVLLVLTLGIGYMAVTNLSKSNDRLSALYQEDMLGAMRVNDIAVARAMNGRSVRDAMLHLNQPAIVAEDEKTSFSEIASIHSDIEEAAKSAHSKESQDVLAVMSKALPAYEQGHHEIYQRIEAKDLEGAQTRLAQVTEEAKPLFDAAAQAIEIKQQHAKEKFEINDAEYRSARALVIGASVISLVLGVILSIVIARGFSVPLAQAVKALEQLAGGDLTVVLDVDTHDEVGHMATAMNRAVQMLSSTMQEVAESATGASSASQQLAAATESIASGAQEQAASLEETSASLEEITAAVRQSANHAIKASELASGSQRSSEYGQDGTSAIAAMAEISSASAKISDIIATVDEIAFQTNLLAVNAAVEAARAGDEGRGFAVVASEVRSLAQRSAGAAKEIKSLIQDSMRKVERGSELVNRVTGLVSEIAHSSSEQSSGIEQVNTAMTQMDQVTQANSAQTEELSATAQSLSEQAARLLELVSTFKLNQFGGGVWERQSFQQREMNAAHSLGASLVHSASANLDRATLTTSQRVGKAARSSSQAKAGLPRARASKTLSVPPPVLTAAAAGRTAESDAKFEEF
ncbi:MAG: methyl-accepting chemotaxis protein [Terracidiphilus sp.]